MPKIAVYNQEGKTTGDIELSDAVFGLKPDQALVHEVTVALQANKRHAVASTKTKGEVRGGGIKPWRQKGTGRARQGSIRSPNWVGGGIVFGPNRERNFSVKINRKAKQKALFMVLSDKLQEKTLLILDQMKTEPAKTKIAADVLKRLPLGKTTLLVSPKSDPALLRMIRNIPNVTLTTANSLNMLDVLAHRSIVFLKDAVPAFEKLYV
ncbi:MAG TPA: 50S ribosomal protein L4 [Patescibacteria group bacterium]|nr:50S ribosomal protein L4 [Patescibacteria group bacterium]